MSNAGDFDEMLRSAVLHIPSRFERLVFIASLHSPEACAQFCQQFLASGYDHTEIDGALWREHHAIFEDWLALNLEQKRADLEQVRVINVDPPASAGGQGLYGNVHSCRDR